MKQEPIGGAPLTDDELTGLGKTLGTLLHRLTRARQDNADVGTVSVLSILAKCGPMRASDLARELLLDLSTVSRHAQSLERSGLIEKVADPTDRRAMTLHLTGDGKGHIEEVWERRLELMREGLAHWDPDDLRTLSRLLARYAEDFNSIIARTYEEKHGKTTTEEGH
jgi:DNA-binding MarR family transcriptional regulator